MRLVLWCGVRHDAAQVCNVDTLLRYRLGCVWKILCCFLYQWFV